MNNKKLTDAWEIKQIFARNLKRIRKGNCVSIARLSKDLQVHLNTPYAWESGKFLPRAEIIVNLAEYFEVPINAFFIKKWEAGDETD